MATANITVTAPIGAGGSTSAKAFNNCRGLHYHFDKEIVEIEQANGAKLQFDFDTVATITHTIATTVSTVSVST